jgi:hypothetical protein
MSFAAEVPWLKRKASQYIRRIPARNLHHAIRLAKSKGLPLNLFVSLNFSLTTCVEDRLDICFRLVRTRFTKWTTQPGRKKLALAAPPTFVWVLENQGACLNAHWLVHVPDERHTEFETKLPSWLEEATGCILDARSIDVRLADNSLKRGRYMLKGMFPSMARNFAIEAQETGWITGRRIGHSRNLGPVELKRMISVGKHPPVQRWKHNKYGQASR